MRMRGEERSRRKEEELKRKGREKEAREMMYRESLNLLYINIYDSKRILPNFFLKLEKFTFQIFALKETYEVLPKVNTHQHCAGIQVHSGKN